MPLKGNPFNGFPFKIPSLNDQRLPPLETAERADMPLRRYWAVNGVAFLFILCLRIYIVQKNCFAAHAAAGSYFFRGKKVTKMPLKGNPFDGFPFKIPSLNDQRQLPLETAERAVMPSRWVWW